MAERFIRTSRDLYLVVCVEFEGDRKLIRRYAIELGKGYMLHDGTATHDPEEDRLAWSIE